MAKGGGTQKTSVEESTTRRVELAGRTVVTGALVITFAGLLLILLIDSPTWTPWVTGAVTALTCLLALSYAQRAQLLGRENQEIHYMALWTTRVASQIVEDARGEDHPFRIFMLRDLGRVILNQVREISQRKLRLPEDARLRVSLFIPVRPPGAGPSVKPSALQAALYDEAGEPAASTSRDYFAVPLDQPGPSRSYANATVEIVNEATILDKDREKPRSILALPIFGKEGTEHVLGVVNIEASQPNLFDVDDVLGLVTLIGPLMSSLALVLSETHPEGYPEALFPTAD